MINRIKLQVSETTQNKLTPIPKNNSHKWFVFTVTRRVQWICMHTRTHAHTQSCSQLRPVLDGDLVPFQEPGCQSIISKTLLSSAIKLQTSLFKYPNAVSSGRVSLFKDGQSVNSLSFNSAFKSWTVLSHKIILMASVVGHTSKQFSVSS